MCFHNQPVFELIIFRRLIFVGVQDTCIRLQMEKGYKRAEDTTGKHHKQ